MTRTALVLILGLAAVAGPVRAQPVPPPQPTDAAPPLEFEDEDEGPLHPPEQVFISPAGEPFRAAVDAPYPVAAWFARADADGDGALTLAEFEVDAERFFRALDADKDGRVDGFENADYERDVAPEINGVLRRPPPRTGGGQPFRRMPSRADVMWGRMPMLSPQQNGPKGPPNRQGAGQYGLLNEPHPVRGGDGDLDGKITLAEARAAARRRFGLLDADSDGRLLAADLPRTPAQILFEDVATPSRRKP